MVPNMFEDLWRLHMNAYKRAARATARANALRDMRTGGIIPLWCYGLSPAPSWLQPFNTAQLTTMNEAAMNLAQTTENELRIEISRSIREANELRTTIQRMYKNASNPDANRAIQRSAGIASFFFRETLGVVAISVSTASKLSSGAASLSPALAKHGVGLCVLFSMISKVLG